MPNFTMMRFNEGPVMKQPFCIALLVGLFLVPASPAQSPQQTRSTFRIGVVFDGPWERNADLLGLMKKEISDALSGQTTVLFPDDKTLVGDWTVPGSVRLNTKLIGQA